MSRLAGIRQQTFDGRNKYWQLECTGRGDAGAGGDAAVVTSPAPSGAAGPAGRH